MGKLFDLENPVMRGLSRLADMMILNLLTRTLKLAMEMSCNMLIAVGIDVGAKNGAIAIIDEIHGSAVLSAV